MIGWYARVLRLFLRATGASATEKCRARQVRRCGQHSAPVDGAGGGRVT